MRLLLLTLLAACGPDVSISKVAIDADSDGYDVEKDCDDGRSDVNPTAPEVCDGRDNDCDEVVDEEAVDVATFYADGDGDDFGDADAPIEACEAPKGTTEDATDCDDADGAVFPGAAEVCNGKDDDCDGDIDGDALDQVTLYADVDGDAYGDAATGVTACEHPAGHVADATDCDDADAAVHPDAPEADCADPTDYNCDGSVAYADLDADGWAACEDCDDNAAVVNPAAAEVCNGLDDDCNALIDDADPGVADPATWYADTDADGYGGATSTAACDAPAGHVATSTDCDDADSDGYGGATSTAACDAPAGHVATSTDCDDTDAADFPGAPETCNGDDEDCDGTADDGVLTTFYADADSDGYGGATSTAACSVPAGHVATSTDCDDADAAAHPGGTEVCGDGVDQDCDGIDTDCGLSGEYTDDDADVVVVGAVAYATLVQGYSSGFDYDGDGWEDIIVGATRDAAAYGGSYGVLDVLTDVPPGTSVAHDIATFHAYGDTSYRRLGNVSSYGLNDLDGDGYGDMLVPYGTGTMTLILGDQPTSNVVYTSIGTGEYDCATASSAGTSNALTGYQDWLCGYGSGGDDAQGSVTVYSGVGTLVGTMVGENRSDGAAVMHGGDDLDGDGYDDYVIGAMGEDSLGSNSGAVYVVYAPISSSATLDLADADAKVTGITAEDRLGRRIEGAADVDADGYPDIVSSAHGDSRGATSGGSATVYFGPLYGPLTMASADVTVYGTAGIGIGQDNSCVSVGDADGDAILDLLVGAGAEASAGTFTGRAWLLYGPLASAYDLGAGDYDSAFSATRSDEYFSYRCTLTDLNHDGVDDVEINAFSSDYGGTEDVGAIYGFYGG